MVAFSVVIPAYNGERYIDVAIQSALDQSHPPQEIIVVDDGSADRTRQVAESFGPRVTVITQENGGVAAARNAGVKAARGEWIALLDQDDYFLPQKLAQQAALIERDPQLVLVYAGYLLVRESAVVDERAAFPASDLWPALRYRSAITPCSAVIRKSALAEIGFFNAQYRMCDDWECWLRLLRRYSAASFAAVPDPLCAYRLWDGNHSKKSIRMLAEIERVIELAVGDLPPLPRFFWRNQILGRHYGETAIDLREQDLGGYLPYIAKSILYWPFGGRVASLFRYKVAAHMALVDTPRRFRQRHGSRPS